MRAGRMDRRVVVEQLSETQDDYGAPVQAWSTWATLFAQYEPVKGREAFMASQTMAEIDARFTIRWRAGLSTTMRIAFEDRLFDIVEILEIGRRRGLQILARAQAE